jgi:hypothetical protein
MESTRFRNADYVFFAPLAFRNQSDEPRTPQYYTRHVLREGNATPWDTGYGTELQAVLLCQGNNKPA